MIDLTADVSFAEPKTLARLAEFSSESPVISLFVDLGPNFLTPPARQSEINSLLTLANDEIAGKEGKAHYEAALDALKVYLEENDEWVLEARGAAIYLSTDGELFEIVKSLEPLEREVVIADWPQVEPLVDVVSGERWCVMLISRTVARYLVGLPNRLRELTSIEDDVHGQHSQGGWSQARYQRSVEKEVKDHIKASCEELRDIYRRRKFDCLVVVTLPEMWPEVEAELHADIKKLLVGTLEFDVENSGINEIENEVEQLADVRSNDMEKELIGTLRESLGRGERSAAGLEDVLAAVTENKVDTLILDEGFSATGVACTSCGWSGLKGKQCPVDSKPLRQEIDLKDWATRRTLAASGQVRVVKFNPDLQAQGGIAALLRY